MGEVKISGARFEEAQAYAERTGKTVQEVVEPATVEFLDEIQQGR